MTWKEILKSRLFPAFEANSRDLTTVALMSRWVSRSEPSLESYKLCFGAVWCVEMEEDVGGIHGLQSS